MPLRCLLSLSALACLLASGCAMVPKKLHQPQFHNPWPQLRTVAIAPFYNLSQNPTVNQDDFASAYYSELQSIPGFEVVPVGVTRRAMAVHGIRGASEADFQQLARLMDVDAVVVGTVNEFSPYYPPRLAMTVRWYSANTCFHPMPNGYGLPWGRAEEEYIPQSLVEAAEFDLATAQLATQTPLPPIAAEAGASTSNHPTKITGQPASLRQPSLDGASINEPPPTALPVPSEDIAPGDAARANAPATIANVIAPESLPFNWPDPRGFIPPAPQPFCPECQPHAGPILTHTSSYNGNDSDFTAALASYYEFQDEARFGGWQSYLQRSEDFARFCCYMHITEMLAARGGAGETKVVYRWPISRYER